MAKSEASSATSLTTASATSSATTATASWFYLPLGDALLASVVKETIREAFALHWQAAGSPAPWSLWLRTESGDLHCQQTLFFAPACAELARHYGAQQTTQPSRANLEWLAGGRDLL